MSNQTYDKIKLIALIVAPALVFISTLTGIWHVPYQQEITATLAALDTLIGAVVAVAKKLWEENNEL